MHATPSRTQASGMARFTLIWVGQILSVLATQMTSFALTIWVFQESGSATALGLMQVFWVTPFLLISPFAGVMVDRYNRKLMMMVSDIGAGLATVALLVLQLLGWLQIWHLYIVMLFQGLGNAFQTPAYMATISSMLPKEQFGRANGMMSLIDSGPGILAPMLAGALLGIIKLHGILVIDILTFGLAILILVFVTVPQPAKTYKSQKRENGILKEALYGLQYIWARPSLTGLTISFLLINLFGGIALTLFAPLVLARTQNNSVILGTVQSSGAIAGVAGGILMSVWGGSKRRIHSGYLGVLIASLLGIAVFGLGQNSLLWIFGIATFSLMSPILGGSIQAIWQAKVAPDVQGRVFSTRRLISWFTTPITPIIAGTLADYVLEPTMQSKNWLSQTFGDLFGTNSGSGMGLLIFACGLGVAGVCIASYMVPNIRNVEDILPDIDMST
jgi:DHA3 family macrolide efflux protein-like MFS transporter